MRIQQQLHYMNSLNTHSQQKKNWSLTLANNPPPLHTHTHQKERTSKTSSQILKLETQKSRTHETNQFKLIIQGSEIKQTSAWSLLHLYWGKGRGLQSKKSRVQTVNQLATKILQCMITYTNIKRGKKRQKELNLINNKIKPPYHQIKNMHMKRKRSSNKQH